MSFDWWSFADDEETRKARAKRMESSFGDRFSGLQRLQQQGNDFLEKLRQGAGIIGQGAADATGDAIGHITRNLQERGAEPSGIATPFGPPSGPPLGAVGQGALDLLTGYPFTQNVGKPFMGAALGAAALPEELVQGRTLQDTSLGRAFKGHLNPVSPDYLFSPDAEGTIDRLNKVGEDVSNTFRDRAKNDEGTRAILRTLVPSVSPELAAESLLQTAELTNPVYLAGSRAGGIGKVGGFVGRAGDIAQGAMFPAVPLALEGGKQALRGWRAGYPFVKQGAEREKGRREVGFPNGDLIRPLTDLPPEQQADLERGWRLTDIAGPPPPPTTPPLDDFVTASAGALLGESPVSAGAKKSLGVHIRDTWDQTLKATWNDYRLIQQQRGPDGKLVATQELKDFSDALRGRIGMADQATLDIVDGGRKAAGIKIGETWDREHLADTARLMIMEWSLQRASRKVPKDNPWGKPLLDETGAEIRPAIPWMNDPVELTNKITEMRDRLQSKGWLQDAENLSKFIREQSWKNVEELHTEGIIRPKVYEYLKTLKDDYVPFDVIEYLPPDMQGVSGHLDNLPSGIRPIKGTSKDIDHPLIAAALRQAQHEVMIAKYQTLKALVKAWEPAGLVKQESFIPSDVRSSLHAGVEKTFINLQTENGTWHRWRIDPSAQAAVNDLFASVTPGNRDLLTRLFSMTAAPVRKVAVTLNASFIPVNFINDMYTAMTTYHVMPLGPSYLKGVIGALGFKDIDEAVARKWMSYNPEIPKIANRGGMSQSGVVEIGMSGGKRESVRTHAEQGPRTTRNTINSQGFLQPLATGAAGAVGGALAAPEDDRLEGAWAGALLGASLGRGAYRFQRAAGIADVAKAFPGGLYDIMIKPMLDLGQIVEKTPRLAIANKVYRNTGDVRGDAQRMALAARRGTMDFQEGGSLTKALGQAVPFFNIGVQGTRLLINTARRDPKTVAWTAPLVLASAGSWWWNHYGTTTGPDGEEISNDVLDKDVPDEIRNNYYYAISGAFKDEYGKVRPVVKGAPLRQFRLLTLPLDGALNWAAGKDPKRLENAFGQFLGGTINILSHAQPINFEKGLEGVVSSVTPPIFRGPMEVATNYDTFRGRTIEPLELTGVPKRERATPFTSATSRVLAPIFERAGLSPLQSDYIARSFGGGADIGLKVADTMLKAAHVAPPPLPREIPNPTAADDLVGQIARTPVISRFYRIASGGLRQAEQKAIEQEFGSEAFDQVREARRVAFKRGRNLDKEQAVIDTAFPQKGGKWWRAENAKIGASRADVNDILRIAYPAQDFTPEQMERFKKILDSVDPRDTLELAVDGYRAIQPEMDEDGLPDIKTLRVARKEYLANLHPETAAAVEAKLSEKKTAVQKKYEQAIDEMGRYQSTPRYNGFDAETGNMISQVLVQAREKQRATPPTLRDRRAGRQTGMTLKQAIQWVTANNPKLEDYYASALWVQKKGAKAINHERLILWQSSPTMQEFYGTLPSGSVVDAAT